MKTITLIDKEFEIFISHESISAAIDRIVEELNSDYKNKEPLFLVMLNGAFMFATDIFKKIDFCCEISFVKYSSYKGTSSTQNVKKLIGVNEDINGKDIIIIEDIVDSGLTMETLLKEIALHKPKSVKIATLLFKPEAFIKDFKIDYIGFEIPNDFIVGYGLDYNGKGRNYPEIYKVKS